MNMEALNRTTAYGSGGTEPPKRESNWTREERKLSEDIEINAKFVDDLIQKIGPILSPEQPLLAETANKPPGVEQPLAPLADAIRELRKTVARTNSQLRAALSRIEV